MTGLFSWKGKGLNLLLLILTMLVVVGAATYMTNHTTSFKTSASNKKFVSPKPIIVATPKSVSRTPDVIEVPPPRY